MSSSPLTKNLVSGCIYMKSTFYRFHWFSCSRRMPPLKIHDKIHDTRISENGLSCSCHVDIEIGGFSKIPSLNFVSIVMK